MQKSEVSRNQQYISIKVYRGIDYTVKIISANGYSSAQYLFRAKIYTTRKGCVFYGPDEINNTIDFSENRDVIIPHMIDMGLDRYWRGTYMATEAYNEFPEYDLIVMTNHADSGEFHFKNGTKLYAGEYIYNSNNAGLGLYGAGALSQTKLMCFVGCNSGRASSIHGNLIDRALTKGAKCSIGWTEEIYHDDVLLWHEHFYESLEQGNTVGEALADAKSWMDYYELNDQLMIYEAIIATYTGTSTLDSITFN